MRTDLPADSTSVRWTSDQLLGITLTGKSLLVSAAAGSGKTAVLAERCVHLVCDAEPRCDIDELLVVTFTEDAASQMRTRINQALRARHAVDPSERLARQLALVEQAQVSTLHAFCAKLLRQHFHLVGLDPGFRVLDGQEAGLLRKEVATELFERYYDTKGDDFFRLIDGYGNGNDPTVIGDMLHLHELLTSVADPAAWRDRARDQIVEAIELPLAESQLGKELSRTIERGLLALCARCEQAIEKVAAIGFPAYAGYLNDIGATLRYWREVFVSDGIDALAEVVKDIEWPKLAAVRGDPPGKELAKSLVDSVRDETKKGPWRDLLRYSTKEWRDGLVKVRPHLDLFLNLVEAFGEKYRREKQALRAVDFADLERLALQALTLDGATRDGKRGPSPAARGYHRRFAHVLVDEYQDINEVQDAILSLVSRECLGRQAKKNAGPNLFCVGDVKQSIYRFRLAEPARFLDRHRQYRGPGSNGQVIDLQANFRSRAPLIDALNSVFKCLMTADAVDIEYDDSHHLVSGIDYPTSADGYGFHGAPIDLHLLPADVSGDEANSDADEGDGDELDRGEREAMLIAGEIRTIIGQGGAAPMQVMAKDGQAELSPRDAKFSDIVILLRSMRFKAEQFAGVLRRSGIAVHVESRTGYFESMEVRDMMSLLNLLDNRRQDIPLAGLLRSPLGRLDDPETSLARIRGAYPESVPFFDAAFRYKDEKDNALALQLRDFFENLLQWRQAAQRQPLADVIWDIYRRSGYLTYVAGLASGEQRVENLLYLHERAAQFDGFQSRGLSRFLRFLDQLREESDLGQPSIASAADNAVRIMSVHGAKGLEFPIVVVPDLGKLINMQDCHGAILADRKAGLGMRVVDEEKRCRYPSLAWTIVQNRLRQQSLAEELRVLYVAMTRAREHLILVGTCPRDTPEKWGSRWRGHRGPLPSDVILGARTMLDWLGPVSAMMMDRRPAVFRANVYTPEQVAAWRTQAAASRPQMTPRQIAMANLTPLPSAPAPSPDVTALIDRVAFSYRWQKYGDIRAAQSVTSRSHSESGRVPESSARTGPSALSLMAPKFIEHIPLSAADRGTATHLVLQHLNFAGACDDSDVAVQIATLVERRILTDAQAQAVDGMAIAWFLASEVGMLMRSMPAAAVRRELPVNFPMECDVIGARSGDPLDRVMIRGRIDALILRTKTHATLLDYKTDAVSADQAQGRAESYRQQLLAYREAIEAIAKIKIDQVYLAFLTPRKLIEL
ncbi:MAG TPA: helicase-exonuclease AddAB subunit AddA [Tepidisphaeraceae bacterium]|jgi:ATP-dependent helicase/nuclease subunit A|nr:helicase-exonuclease AddAB subunit AddA [Tepidisphaeraceae bacterium]